MSDSSEFEIRKPASQPAVKILKKKKPKIPKEEMLKEAKKATTKEMVHEALTNLVGNSKKGVSLYAIKKYMENEHRVETNKINHYIKKYLKTAVEEGAVLQTKGIGASGSFKLANKQKSEKPKMQPKEKPKKLIADDEKVEIPAKKKKTQITKKEEEIQVVPKKKEVSKSKKNTEKKKDTSIKTMIEDKNEKVNKKNSTKAAKSSQASAKKKMAFLKRKSTGSIIKPPKMRPKAKA